jgi:hypothetical protein
MYELWLTLTIFKLKWISALFCVAMHFEERTWIKEHSKLYLNPTINAPLRHCWSMIQMDMNNTEEISTYV